MKQQPALKEKSNQIFTLDLIVDNRKNINNLGLHENVFEHDDLSILFSNIMNIFFQEGDNVIRTLIHFNIEEPILNGKLLSTLKVEFFLSLN